MKKSIVLTVTNDLSYDQRMRRIAASLQRKGYAVKLVGRVRRQSIPLDQQPFAQYRIRCFFEKGFPFYAEYNLRLFFYLLGSKWDAVGVVDLDTLAAGTLAAVLRKKPRVFDAHEYFTEVPEVTNRRFVKAFWAFIARWFLPFYKHAYTVGPALAEIFTDLYGIPFQVIRNVPHQTSNAGSGTSERDTRETDVPILLYQGALNEGRGIEALLVAMQTLEGFELWLAGEGDLSDALRRQAEQLGVSTRVRFLGYVKPEELKKITPKAWLGLNLLEFKGLSYYYSLANKYFDSVHAGIPVLTMKFPEYEALQHQHSVAILIEQCTPGSIVNAVMALYNAPDRYEQLQQACKAAGAEWIWEKEELVLYRVWASALQ